MTALSSPPSHDQVLDALRTVHDPALRKDVVALGFVKDVQIDGSRVAVTIELATPAFPARARLEQQARQALQQLDGVDEVTITMKGVIRSATAPEHGRPPLPGVKNVIAVGAGKGGVGKTTVAVNLAVALSRAGSRVGILDGDLYGPNVPIMFGLQAELVTDGAKIVPAEKFGIQIVSIGFMTSEENPVIWRGPMLHGAIKQFFGEVAWRDLDYLIVDMPPGTGDVALSLSQTVAVAGAVVVTTPQQVSLSDSRRAVRMYQKLNIPTLGVVENMSYHACVNCGHEADLFGRGGGEQMAEQLGVPFLGRLPLYQPIRVGSDRGIPLVIAEPTSPVTEAFIRVAEEVTAQVARAAQESTMAHKGKIPLVPVR